MQTVLDVVESTEKYPGAWSQGVHSSAPEITATRRERQYKGLQWSHAICWFGIHCGFIFGACVLEICLLVLQVVSSQVVPSRIEFVLVGSSRTSPWVSHWILLVHILILSSLSPQSGMDGNRKGVECNSLIDYVLILYFNSRVRGRVNSTCSVYKKTEWGRSWFLRGKLW